VTRPRPSFADPDQPLSLVDSTAALRWARLAAEACGEGVANTEGGLRYTWRYTPAKERSPARHEVELRGTGARQVKDDDRHLLAYALGEIRDGFAVLDWNLIPEEGLLVATVGIPPRPMIADGGAAEF
jgi:hypothetical protein